MNLEYESDPCVVLFSFKPHPVDLPDGWFDSTDGKIYICSDKSPLLRELIYYHEDTHKTCWDNGCFCWRQHSDYWGEYHAFREEFRRAILSDCTPMIQLYFRRLDIWMKKYRSEKIWKSHLQALRKVIKLSEFQTAAKKYGYGRKLRGWLRG